MKCRVVVPGVINCPNDAKGVVVFKDDDRVPACQDCQLRLGQLAGSMGSTIKVEELPIDESEK